MRYLLSLLLVAGAYGLWSEKAYAQPDFQREIETIFRRATPHTLTGYVQNLSGSYTYFQWNPDSSLIPASNQKMVTTATGYHFYGPNAFFATDTWSGRLSSAFSTINKPSNNAWADATLRHLGRLRSGSNSFGAGAVVVREYLQLIGATDPGYGVGDGSGLSRFNRISSSSLMRLMRNMYQNPSTRGWFDTLAVAGVDGTIRRRLTGADTRGRVRAKTGTLRDVIALSGIVSNRYNGHSYFFSFVMNEVRDLANARRTIDRAVALLASNFSDPIPDSRTFPGKVNFISPGKVSKPTVTLSVVASEDIARVVYLADRRFTLGESSDRDNNFALSYTFNTVGKRTITAYGYDSNRNLRAVEDIEVNLDPGAAEIDLILPAGEVTNPLELSAKGSDEIARVRYVADGKYPFAESEDKGADFGITYSFQTIGRRVITAEGYNGAGKLVASNSLAVKVLEGPSSSLSFVTPGNRSSNPVLFTVEASEDIERVEYLVDGRWLIGAGDASQEGFPLNYTFFTVGQRRVEAIGYDAQGVEAEVAEIVVTIQ